MRTGFNSFLPALFLALFVLIPFNAFGQTASDFETKYGAQKYYPVRPFSLIRPQYDVRGQMCRAEILPNHDLEPFKPYEDPVKPNEDPGEIDITEIPLYFVAPGPLYDKGDTEHRFPIYTVDVAELRSIIDELIPAKNRIGKGTAQLDMSGFGGSYRAELRFDNVVLYTRVVVIDPPKTLNLSRVNGSLDRFLEAPFNDITFAEIVWTTRTCSHKR